MSSLYLVILGKKKVVESAELAWMDKTIKRLVPKREPNQKTDKSKIWIIKKEHRQNLVNKTDRVLEETNSRERLFGYFGLMGIVSRWIEHPKAIWGLYLSSNEVIAGELLKK